MCSLSRVSNLFKIRVFSRDPTSIRPPPEPSELEVSSVHNFHVFSDFGALFVALGFLISISTEAARYITNTSPLIGAFFRALKSGSDLSAPFERNRLKAANFPLRPISP
ncbi:hypothetical protein Tco_0466333 [Tanacetum coccineum]